MKGQDEGRAVAIGERIRQARLENGGMKQRELADLLGVSERSVIAYEAGEVIPYRFIRDLERALGKSAAWFLHGDAAPVTDETLVEEIRSLREAIEGLAARLDK